jgi:hypothetical protein
VSGQMLQMTLGELEQMTMCAENVLERGRVGRHAVLVLPCPTASSRRLLCAHSAMEREMQVAKARELDVKAQPTRHVLVFVNRYW